jgi:probable phosphoglycerate mutase
MTPRRPRRLYLMRHGEVSYFAADGRPLDPRTVSLTAQGRAQAEAAQAVLAGVGIERVFASPLPRTQETARLAPGGQSAVEVIDDLHEVRAGRLRDIPAAERRDRVATAYHGAEQPGATFLGGEEMAAFAARVTAAWDRLCFADPAPWACALLVAHDAVNRVILAHLLGCDLSVIERLEQDLAGIAIIDLAEAACSDLVLPSAVVRAMNITAHDLGKAQLRLNSMEWVAQSL